VDTMLQESRNHKAERSVDGLIAKPLNAKQTAALIELIKIHRQVKEVC